MEAAVARALDAHGAALKVGFNPYVHVMRQGALRALHMNDPLIVMPTGRLRNHCALSLAPRRTGAVGRHAVPSRRPALQNEQHAHDIRCGLIVLWVPAAWCLLLLCCDRQALPNIFKRSTA